MMNRRKFIAASVAAASGASLGLNAGPVALNSVAASRELPSLNGRKILYTVGGWDGHEPWKSVELFKPWLESEGASVDVSDNLDPYADPEYMASVDLVIQIFTMSSISEEQEKGLLAAVKSAPVR